MDGSTEATGSEVTAAPINQEDAKKKDIQDNKDLAALSYIWILSIVVFFARKNSPFVRFHAKQGIALFVASIVLWIVPVVGKILELAVLGGIIYGFMQAAEGLWTEVPLVGPASRKDFKGVRQDWQRVVQFLVHAVSAFRQKRKPEEKKSSTPPQPLPPPQNP